MSRPATYYDVVVIGTGPGGEGVAIMLAKSGKRVVVVEKHCMVGGGCTHWGTIPSKTFIHVARQYGEQTQNRLIDCAGDLLPLDADRLMTAVTDVVEQQVNDRAGFYRRNGIEVVEGFARFADPHTVEVCVGSEVTHVLHGDSVVIASGTHPYRPDDVDFYNLRVVDSDTVLKMRTLPKVLTVYGAGVVGCEYASAFRGLGVDVNLINTRPRILEFLDDEISAALGDHMCNQQGIKLLQGAEYQRVEVGADGVLLQLQSGQTIRSDMLLWANGRSGNIAGMNLEAVGIAADSRGQIAVNGSYQTAVPHIYAVGDIIGSPNLASAAYDQGRFAACHIISGQCDTALVSDIPTGIYTRPEVSCVGMTEQELVGNGIPFESGRAHFRNLARGQISDHKVGMLKLLFDPDSLAILGVHCFGHSAADLLHLGQSIMAQPSPLNSIRYFINTTFNYPTMAEAYRVAALNGYNKLRPGSAS